MRGGGALGTIHGHTIPGQAYSGHYRHMHGHVVLVVFNTHGRPVKQVVKYQFTCFFSYSSLRDVVADKLGEDQVEEGFVSFIGLYIYI